MTDYVSVQTLLEQIAHIENNVPVYVYNEQGTFSKLNQIEYGIEHEELKLDSVDNGMIINAGGLRQSLLDMLDFFPNEDMHLLVRNDTGKIMMNLHTIEYSNGSVKLYPKVNYY